MHFWSPATRTPMGRLPESKLRKGDTLYTVHDQRTGCSYGLRHEKTAIVAFRSYQDAFTVSRALEYHLNKHGAYPPHNLEEEPRALEQLFPAPPAFYSPKHLSVCTWPFLEELVETCQQNSLNLMFCVELSRKPHIRFKGDVFHIEEPPLSTLVNSLNMRLLDRGN